MFRCLSVPVGIILGMGYVVEMSTAEFKLIMA